MTQCSVLRDMQLCTTIEALDMMSADHTALQFQGLLILENILGPSHPETTQQVQFCIHSLLINKPFKTYTQLYNVNVCFMWSFSLSILFTLMTGTNCMLLYIN